MNKPITFRTAISAMLIFLFSLPVHAQELSSLEGIAQDENGELMTGVVVEVFSDGIKRGTAITGYDGSYVIKPLQNGVYELRARYAAYEDVEIKEMPVASGGPTTLYMNFTPKVFSEVTFCGWVKPLTMPEPVACVAVTGRLKDAFNRPAPGVSVEFYRFDTNGIKIDTISGSATTSEKGCYKFNELDPGVYTFVTDFNGVKTMKKTVVITNMEYVNEKVVDFFFNRKISDRFGVYVEHTASR